MAAMPSPPQLTPGELQLLLERTKQQLQRALAAEEPDIDLLSDLAGRLNAFLYLMQQQEKPNS